MPIFSVGFLAFLLLSYTSCLYVLEIKPLSVASFETIFSHSISCLFVFFLVSFAVQKLVSLIRSHWFIFAFISVALETDLRKNSCLGCMSVLVPVPHCLDDCGFVILPEVWESYATCLVFVPQDCSGNSGSFMVPRKILDCLF